jgi:hypothetical protein
MHAQQVSLLAFLLLVPAVAPAAPSPPDGGAAPAAARSPLGGYLEQDLGVLLMSGGVGLFGGVRYGSLRGGLGFYRFQSPIPALSGAPAGFELSVDAILSADVAWHPLDDDMRGPYLRVVGQLKRQRVENRTNGARRTLDSTLLGPEIGWVARVWRDLYLAPRAGALFYLVPPQGKAGGPVDVGGLPYDNPKHQTVDLYVTLGLGWAF